MHCWQYNLPFLAILEVVAQFLDQRNGKRPFFVKSWVFPTGLCWLRGRGSVNLADMRISLQMSVITCIRTTKKPTDLKDDMWVEYFHVHVVAVAELLGLQLQDPFGLFRWMYPGTTAWAASTPHRLSHQGDKSTSSIGIINQMVKTIRTFKWLTNVFSFQQWLMVHCWWSFISIMVMKVPNSQRIRPILHVSICRLNWLLY